jgi:hypothetical protein
MTHREVLAAWDEIVRRFNAGSGLDIFLGFEMLQIASGNKGLFLAVPESVPLSPGTNVATE